MGFVRRTMRFGGGVILGAAVGTAVSVLLAPQSGPELQGEISDRREKALRAGEEAEILETERLKREFRVAVNDPTALTGKFDRPGAPTQVTSGGPPAGKSEADKARERAEKEQREAEKARQQARKAEEDARKAQEKAAQARAKAAKEEAEAAEARTEAERKTASS